MGDPLVVLNNRGRTFGGFARRFMTSSVNHPPVAKPLDPVTMFKVLVLQSLYNISDQQMEYPIKDRMSFMRFLGLNLEDKGGAVERP